MTKILICDDNYELCEFLKGMLVEEYDSSVNVTVYKCAEDLMAEIHKHEERKPADIILLDIDINGTNGIDVAEQLQGRFCDLKVIFITGHIDYSTEIFRVKPSNFIVKPIDRQKLLQAIDKVREELEEEEHDSFVITFKGNVFKVKANDILYFESEKRTVILHSRQGSWTIYRKLDEVQKELPDYFLRCHQSYLVNMNEIKSLRPLRIELNQGEEIPVSRPKYKETKERFFEFIGQS